MEKKKPGTVTAPKENVKELLGKAKSNLTSAASELTADGNYFIHNCMSPLLYSYLTISGAKFLLIS